MYDLSNPTFISKRLFCFILNPTRLRRGGGILEAGFSFFNIQSEQLGSTRRQWSADQPQEDGRQDKARGYLDDYMTSFGRYLIQEEEARK